MSWLDELNALERTAEARKAELEPLIAEYNEVSQLLDWLAEQPVGASAADVAPAPRRRRKPRLGGRSRRAPAAARAQARHWPLCEPRRHSRSPLLRSPHRPAAASHRERDRVAGPGVVVRPEPSPALPAQVQLAPARDGGFARASVSASSCRWCRRARASRCARSPSVSASRPPACTGSCGGWRAAVSCARTA